MFVDTRASEVDEIEALATHQHCVCQGRRFGAIEPLEKAGHEQGRHLVVGHMALGIRQGECTPLTGFDAGAVALTLDQPMCEHLPLRGVFSTTHPTSLEQYMRLVTTVAAVLLLGNQIGRAQTAADSNSYTWLVNAAHAAVDSGEFNANDAERKRLYKNAEQYSRRAAA